MDDHYDVLVVGTGLTEAVLSAALSRAGKRVLHVDPHAYYGAQWASLTLSELGDWAREAHADLRFPRGPLCDEQRALDRHYSLALRPAILPAYGPMMEALVRSNVASYATFRLLGRVGVVTQGQLARVPSSKSDIFRDARISLADKRRLMRFLQAATSPGAYHGVAAPMPAVLRDELQLDEQLMPSIVHGVSLCWDDHEPAATAMERTRRTLRGYGRYGPSPFLVGQYGGAGELAQGFCRASAVHGGVFILGHAVTALRRDGSAWSVRLDGIDVPFTAAQVAAPRTLVPSLVPADTPPAPGYEHMALLITDAPIDWATHMPLDEGELPPETALLVVPPQGPSQPHAAMILAQGEGTFACPKGQYVYYVMSHTGAGIGARFCLEGAVAHLHSLLASADPWLVEMYASHARPAQYDASSEAYIDTLAPLPATDGPRTSLCMDEEPVHTQAVPNLSETLDQGVAAAEHAFWRLVGPELRDAAQAAAMARAQEHDPAEYHGRGGAEPALRAPIQAPIEFLPRQTSDYA
ncbi:unnamed protein product [Malassezia sympodialis ATCC 42132]|uniref:Similar to S.cerevisiae protein MRS6 (Rab escort protein) n=1 Tax=Malassezia sympodialis (strain ATCC 42132) TaxID=1230383 RepID=M5E5Y1_MALS4|nr:uncharacterized protein MSY001_0535 [Malassezia sympodialis ATCC 42132]CCU97829.1 unnamed protein product [Malassezia sympodialis ATCC 42132]SHO77794.1 Similar to S.cerevisiae protein MRS6 (Rab escort protein) [Malassezia sympodialis ATCC 42132]|eukprot:XP_018739162.1 uncharacterized protein MSY001_0535 [Malassezia sympodialis ATCC 42132]